MHATPTTIRIRSLASPVPPVELFYPFVQWSIQAGGRALAERGRGRNEDEWMELPRERRREPATCFPAGPAAAVSAKRRGRGMRISSCLRERLTRPSLLPHLGDCCHLSPSVTFPVCYFDGPSRSTTYSLSLPLSFLLCSKEG